MKNKTKEYTDQEQIQKDSSLPKDEETHIEAQDWSFVEAVFRFFERRDSTGPKQHSSHSLFRIGDISVPKHHVIPKWKTRNEENSIRFQGHNAKKRNKHVNDTNSPRKG